MGKVLLGYSNTTSHLGFGWPLTSHHECPVYCLDPAILLGLLSLLRFPANLETVLSLWVFFPPPPPSIDFVCVCGGHLCYGVYVEIR